MSIGNREIMQDWITENYPFQLIYTFDVEKFPKTTFMECAVDTNFDKIAICIEQWKSKCLPKDYMHLEYHFDEISNKGTIDMNFYTDDGLRLFKERFIPNGDFRFDTEMNGLEIETIRSENLTKLFLL